MKTKTTAAATAAHTNRFVCVPRCLLYRRLPSPVYMSVAHLHAPLLPHLWSIVAAPLAVPLLFVARNLATAALHFLLPLLVLVLITHAVPLARSSVARRWPRCRPTRTATSRA